MRDLYPLSAPRDRFPGPDHEDRFPGPVGSLWRYLEATKPKGVSGLRRLFVSPNPDYEKDIWCATLARWISKVMTFAI